MLKDQIADEIPAGIRTVTSPYRKVLAGLRLSSVGLWLVALSVVLITSLALYSSLHIHRDGVHYFAVAAMARNIEYGGLGLIAVGLLLGFVGRCLCLPVPPAAGTAPARIGLAVIFEACSLLSAAAFVGVVYLLPLPSVVSLTWCLFSWLTAYLARVKFLQFARSLAEHLDPALVPEAKAVQRLYLYVPGGFILSYGVAAAGVLLRSNTGDGLYEAIGVFLGWLVASAATLFGIIGVWRWGGLLVGLRKAVMRTKFVVADDASDDPDRPYLERYVNAARSDRTPDHPQL